MEEKQKKNRKLMWVGVGIAAFLLIGAVGILTEQPEDNKQTKQAVAQETVEKPIVITAEQLAKEIQTERTETTNTYDRRPMQITGAIAKITPPSEEGDPYILQLYAGKNALTEIEAEVSDKDKAAALREKDVVVVKGTAVIIHNIRLEDASIIETKKYEDTEAYKQEMKANAEKKKAQAEHQKVIAELEKKMKQESDSILSFTMPTDNIFYLKVKNEWYLLSASEKQYLAETIYQQVNKISNAWFGASAVFSIQDASGKEVATSKLLGGMKIKK